jgi:arsenate reductase-like glutaredoxin family protein
MFGNANGISTHTGVRSRTYDIGESCLHGTVKVAWLDNGKIRIRFYNYKTNDLQEEFIRSFVDKFEIQMLLEDRMSAYYADKIMNDFYV